MNDGHIISASVDLILSPAVWRILGRRAEWKQYRVNAGVEAPSTINLQTIRNHIRGLCQVLAAMISLLSLPDLELPGLIRPRLRILLDQRLHEDSFLRRKCQEAPCKRQSLHIEGHPHQWRRRCMGLLPLLSWNWWQNHHWSKQVREHSYLQSPIEARRQVPAIPFPTTSHSSGISADLRELEILNPVNIQPTSSQLLAYLRRLDRLSSAGCWYCLPQHQGPIITMWASQFSREHVDESPRLFVAE